MSKEKFWQFKNATDGSELIIDGVIASESWFDDEVTPKEFREELSRHSGNITVRINSPGGDVFAGVAIYNMLAEHSGEVTVKVDGLAASIASLIAMAGDKIVMLPGSMMMIHQPWTFTTGNADDLEEVIESLKKIGESMTPIYATRTGLSEERVNELLKAETWMTANDAVELGFADEAVEAKTTISDSIKNALAFAGDVKAAVMQPVMSMNKPKATTQEDSDDTTRQDDKVTVEEQSIVDEAVVETATVTLEEDGSATVTIDLEKVIEKVEDKLEEVAEPQEVKAEIKKETEMSEVTTDVQAKTDIVTEGIQAKAPEAPAKAAAPDMKAYLASNEAMETFARILEAQAQAGSASDLAGTGSSDAVRAAWKEHLEVKMGVTNPEIFLPTPLITEIEDAFKSGGEIWQRVSKTGMDSFNAGWDANSDPDAENGRANGYNRSVAEDKQEQVLTFANRILRPQFVYKYITLNKEDVKEQRTTGALVRFVLSELPRRIIREVERAIVIGDGRASNADDKIQEGNPRGFYSVKADAAGAAPQAVTYTPVAGKTVYENLRRARALVEADGEAILVAKKGLLLDMEFEQNANGGFLFAPGSDLARFIGVSTVVEPDWMENDTNDAYIFVPGYYRVVGDLSIEAFQNFILKTNKNEYLQEIWAGGGLTALNSGVAVAPAGASS